MQNTKTQFLVFHFSGPVLSCSCWKKSSNPITASRHFELLVFSWQEPPRSWGKMSFETSWYNGSRLALQNRIDNKKSPKLCSLKKPRVQFLYRAGVLLKSALSLFFCVFFFFGGGEPCIAQAIKR